MIIEDGNQNPNVQQSMTDIGEYGIASEAERFVKLPDGKFVANSKQQLYQLANAENENNTFIAYLIYPNKRIGTLPVNRDYDLTSALHGQAPGEPIYYIEPNPRTKIWLEPYLRDLINKKGMGTRGDLPDNLSIRQLVDLFDEIKDVQPFEEAISRRMRRFMDVLQDSDKCSIMFSKEDGYDWEYQGIFCNVQELERVAGDIHNTDPGILIRVTNGLADDSFRQSDLTNIDIILLVKFKNHLEEWFETF